MKKSNIKEEVFIVVLASLILGLSLSYIDQNWEATLIAIGLCFIIISINVITKKLVAHNFETEIKTKFWTTYWHGFSSKSHFQKPVAMAWVPLLTSLITKGNAIWMPLLEFETKEKPERIAKRHGTYRYTKVTEWHTALIATAGIVVTTLFGIGGHILGFDKFSNWSIFYAAWSLFPLGRLDGTKIFFGSRKLWFMMVFLLVVTLFWKASLI